MTQKIKSKDFVIRFAGKGGQGLVTSADAMARAATGAGFIVRHFQHSHLKLWEVQHHHKLEFLQLQYFLMEMR